MPVTHDQLAALRTLLTGESEENERIQQKLDQANGWDGYGALITAGFFIAAEKRFAGSPDPEIIEFVSSVRSHAEEISEKVDPVVAERLIRAVHHDESIEDIDTEDAIRIQMVLLVALIRDANLDDAGLDAFISEARPMADQWVDEAP